MKTRRTAFVVACALLTCLSIWIFKSKILSGEPRFNGKPINWYVNKINSPMDEKVQRDGYHLAANALQQMGQPGVTWLAQRIERKDSGSQKGYRALWRAMPIAVQIRMAPPSTAPNPQSSESLIDRRILRALVQVGPGAVPVLTNYLDVSRYGSSTRSDVYSALTFGPLRRSAEPALPILEHNLSETDSLDRIASAYAIASIDSRRTEEMVSALRAALVSGNSRAMAADCLASFGKDAEAAVPDLEAALSDPDAGFRDRARVALQKITGKRFPKK